jgi:signal transduction histidine kinase
VFDPGHTTGGGQNLAGTWPLVGVLAAAVVLAPWLAGLGGMLVASGRVAGALANGERTFTGSRVVSFVSTAVFYAVAAVMWSLVTRRLRVVETEVLARRARDEVARTLHDGVLQTLALVERRTNETDPELAAEARASDRELRAWLYGGGQREPDTLEARLRQAATRVAARFDLPVTVNALVEREPRADVADAVVGAVGEALANAAKHAGAGRVVVFAEVDDEGAVFASVRDDGCGFDVGAARRAGRGLVRSIDERIVGLGGRVELVSRPGDGTEVRMWAT